MRPRVVQRRGDVDANPVWGHYTVHIPIPTFSHTESEGETEGESESEGESELIAEGERERYGKYLPAGQIVRVLNRH